eukprot:CAMPEP_0115115426 /NCGR_PEP_ID=MMETSP0227-20121206/42674_1 /TAXON_ID=89957 /ORGANISM="Polarella glacialis, Strain CCMP 1383" /LENGTH=402 /DNA_ID=CAMNT_0002516073 /DNA_START=89 /DNA_END=1297 /DNA_ORIENTATION=-
MLATAPSSRCLSFGIVCALWCLASATQTNLRSKSRFGAAGSASTDFFTPVFVAPQLTPLQFLIVSSPAQQKIVYTELKNFQSTTGRTYALVDSGLSDPRGLSFDRDRGVLYVADKAAKRIFRYHVYVDETSSGMRTLSTDGTQLCIMQNADTEWVHADVNGDVFYSDATNMTINRIPSGVIDLLARGQYSAGDLTVVSEKNMEAMSGAQLDAAPTEEPSEEAPHVYAVYEGSINPHVGIPAGVVSDGARLYWANAQDGKTKGSVAEGQVKPEVTKTTNGSFTAAFPSLSMTNETDLAFGLARSNKMVFYSTVIDGLGRVNGLAPGGGLHAFAMGLDAPRGLAWDGDQTLYVADQAANTVYSFPVGRLVDDAPLTQSAVLSGAFGVALFSEHDLAWTMKPMDA